MTTFYLDWERGADITADGSPANMPMYRLGNGSLVIDQVRVKYGTYALNLSGANTDAGIGVVLGAGAQFGAGQFTIEAWVNWNTHNSAGYEEILATLGGSNNYGWVLEQVPTNTLQFGYSTTGTNFNTVSTTFTPTLNQWYHIAVDRDASNTIRLYVDGAVIASGASAGAIYPSTRQLTIGNNDNINSRFPGYIGGVRITKGVARYAGAFTAPTAKFPTSSAGDASYASTSLILNFDTNGSGTSFANRWRTLTNGATAARVLAGDTVRMMAAPDPTLVGNATWTNNSRNITLASAVTGVICNCEQAWTASANVTPSISNSFCKEGTYRAVLDIAAAFTTGVVGYQQVSPLTTPTLVNRAANLLGAGTLTLLQNANADEGMTTITLPFGVMYNGRTYTTLYVSSNSFVEFGASAQTYSNISATNPGVPNIQINAGDRAYQRVYAGSEDGNATYRIRFEGTVVLNGTPGSSTIFWEMTFTAATPGVIQIDMGSNAASGTGVSGCSDGIGSYIATFGSGTANTGYTLTSQPAAVDMSAYQQVSFWINNSAAIAANTLSLRLCSDAAGTVAVNTLPIPAIPSSGQWLALTLDNGAPLGSSIQTIALYADADPGTVTVNLDHIIACKASTSPDSLTLTSLIGRVANLSWTANTAYALNDVRRPSQPNRSGFVYKATTAGTTGATEPAWPGEIGLTVADGSVVWTCSDLEDTWYPIASISGTTVRLDGFTGLAGNTSGYLAYQGATETVPTYKREPVRLPTMSNSTYDSPWTQLQRNGTETALTTYTGGWNRTDMSTQTGETWMTGLNSLGMGLQYDNGPVYVAVTNINVTRFSTGHYAYNGFLGRMSNLQATGCQGSGIGLGGSRRMNGSNLVCNNNGAAGIDSQNSFLTATCVTCNGNGGNSPGSGIIVGAPRVRINYFTAKGTSREGVTNYIGNYKADVELRNVSTANNLTAGVYPGAFGGTTLFSAVMTDATPLSLPGNFFDGYVYSHKHGGVANTHLVTTDGGTIRSVTDVRHSSSGIAWRFNPTSINRNALYPMRLSVAKIACTVNVAKTVRIWTRRDNANIKGELVIEGGQLAGVGRDLVVACTPTLNTWEQSAALTFTPTETGVVEVLFRVYDGVNTANNFWIDDLTVT